MFRLLVLLLLLVSIVGLVLSSLLHIATFLSDHLGGIHRYFLFHVGIFAIWLPTLLLFKLKGEAVTPKILPPWSRKPIIALFCYFLFNMIFLLTALKGGGAEIVDGSYQLLEHGKLIQYLTEAEYYRDITIELRFFSSGWMIAYAAGVAYLWHLREIVTPGFREVHFEP